MNKKLFHYQESGRDFLASRYHALLADEMGTGKTVMAVAAVEKLKLKRILVVCPASTRLNWKQEIEECLGSIVGWDIISYNTATAYKNKRIAIGQYDALILDEAHFVKSPMSQRCQAVFGPEGLARRAKYKWLLTGTPCLNRPVELWPMLKCLHPAFSTMSYTAYTQKYCASFWDGYGVNVKGASRLDELAGLLTGFMLRRTKKEVLPELPPKIISRIPLDVSQSELAAVYAEEELISNRESKLSSMAEDFSQLGDMSRLLRLTGLAKVSAVFAFTEDLLTTIDKIVIFAKHREVISRLEAAFSKKGYGVAVLHGGMSDVQKRDAVDAFSKKDARVFIGQIQTAGSGINGLQVVCSHVLFAEISWTPGETSQAVDRCHRIGQTADSVHVYLCHVPGTLESAVLGVHDAKTKVIERLMNDNILEGLL